MKLRGWISTLIVLNNKFESLSTSGGSKYLVQRDRFLQKVNCQQKMKSGRAGQNSCFVSNCILSFVGKGPFSCIKYTPHLPLPFDFFPSSIRFHESKQFHMEKSKMLKFLMYVCFSYCIKVVLLSFIGRFLSQQNL